MNFWGYEWHVCYEHIMHVSVQGDEVIALIWQYVRDDAGHSELREFTAWAPILTIN